MQKGWPVAINAIGSASTATVAWRQGPHCFVTVVVKGTFAFVPNGPMAAIAPEPIFAQEQEGAPGLGLGAADDLAPYLGQTDVTLTGHAPAPRSPAMRSVRVRLSIHRDRAALLDKTLDLEAPLGGAPRPIPIVGMGPISKRWPIRRQLLGAVDPRWLEGTILEIPAAFDWRYFQASSSDLRVGPLQGDEWLVLEGMLPTLERLVTQLPGARAAARLYRQTQAQEIPQHSLALAPDTLRIDVDRRCCSITWRGRFPVSGELSSLHILAGIELPGRPLPWPASAQSAAPSPHPAIDASPEEDPLEGTVMMMDAVFLRASSAASDDPPEGTVGLGDDAAAQLTARPAIPFRSDISSPLAVGVTPIQEAPLASDEDDPLRGTVGLDAVMNAQIAARPATPFVQSELPASAPPLSAAEDDPLGCTAGLDEHATAALAARPATPFRSDLSSPLAIASRPAQAVRVEEEDDPLRGTLWLDERAGTELAARGVVPFQQAVAQAPTLLSALHPDDEQMPRGLGEQFLTAMAAIEAARRVPSC